VDTFHHLRDQAAAAGELMRALATEGRIVVQEPDIRHGAVKLIALGEKVLLMRSHFQPPQAVQRMFESHDARVSVRQEGSHFWLIAEKESAS